ncbi:nitroreductase-like oxidoreductase [Mycena vitilis]|nr:nitroreductase-like oxidoreductase [Mycena vitilis]
MSDAFLAATATRRTNYAITPKSSIPDEKLEAIVKHCVLHSPTPFNMQSSRARRTGQADGVLRRYGSVLLFEDQAVVAAKMPRFTKQLPVWRRAMLQHSVWTALTLEGLGASLQHNGAYSDELVADIQKA